MTKIIEKIRDHYAVFFFVIALLCAAVDIIRFRTAIPEAVLTWIWSQWSSYRYTRKSS